MYANGLASYSELAAKFSEYSKTSIYRHVNQCAERKKKETKRVAKAIRSEDIQIVASRDSLPGWPGFCEEPNPNDRRKVVRLHTSFDEIPPEVQARIDARKKAAEEAAAASLPEPASTQAGELATGVAGSLPPKTHDDTPPTQ